jgi:GT2 family glycosyltransferase
LLSVIILTFNSKKFIKSCLDSVFSQNFRDFEIIVVDNGSEDDTVNFIKENYPEIVLIENKENLGAAKARNQGIRASKGDWILTLDCDVILERDFLSKMKEALENIRDNIGILSPKILKKDRKTIDSVGIYLSPSYRFYDLGKGYRDSGQFNEQRYVFGASACCALYKREMLEDIAVDGQYFDERFFFLVEDVDLAWRAQRKGWRGLFYPQAICYHTGNSSNTSKKLRQYLCWRNRKLLLKKYSPNKFKLAMVSLFYDLPRLLFLFLTNSYVRKEIISKEQMLTPFLILQSQKEIIGESKNKKVFA